jgi:hypothetical protein
VSETVELRKKYGIFGRGRGVLLPRADLCGVKEGRGLLRSANAARWAISP